MGTRRKFIIPLMCLCLGKTETIFYFDFLRVDIRGLYLPSILPALWYHLDLPVETSHIPPSEGEGSTVTPPLPGHRDGPQVPFWWIVCSAPLISVISSRMDMGSKWIIWDSGIRVELSGKRSWAGGLHQSSGVGGGARAQVKRTYQRMKPVKYKARWTDQERDKILMMMWEHPHPPKPVVNSVGLLKPL